jgi:RES domain-containing protein
LTIRAWRIFKSGRRRNPLSGEGPRLVGGRWNNPGTAVVYTAESLALACLEVLVHLEGERPVLRYRAIDVAFDESLVTRVEVSVLPLTWASSPPPPELQRFGDEWVSSGVSAVLRVPSAIIPASFNYLLNPTHSDFSRIGIGEEQAFDVDPRLIQTAGRWMP